MLFLTGLTLIALGLAGAGSGFVVEDLHWSLRLTAVISGLQCAAIGMICMAVAEILDRLTPSKRPTEPETSYRSGRTIGNPISDDR